MDLSELSAQAQFFQRQLNRYIINVKRVTDLLQAAKATEKNKPELEQDILRSAVVLLHATLEDQLRFVASIILPVCDKRVLDDYSLPDKKRKEKFTLGDLRSYWGKSVQTLITESIKAHMETYSFSKTDKIVALLKQMEIEQPDVNLPQIQGMIDRRHKIVHEADMVQDECLGEWVLAPLAANTVAEWLDTVHRFIALVNSSVVRGRLIPSDAANVVSDADFKTSAGPTKRP
jgi:hypothetical protein